MKAIVFKKNGDLTLLNRITKEEEKINTIIHSLDCPTILEEGITFETFFNHLIKEKDFLNTVYKETMGEANLDNFLKEWKKLPTKKLKDHGIEYLKTYKVFDYIELMEDNNFIDIRIDFDGIGEEGDLFNVEFIPLNDLKPIPLVLSNKISIYRTVSNIKGEELFFEGNTFTLLFELIGTILYVLTIHKTPEGRESAKHKFIKIINETNIIDMLEIQKEEAVEVQNYEEAAQLKKILDRLRNGFIDD